MMFFEQLKLKIQESKTRLCLGVDPQIPAGCRLIGKKSEIEVVDQIVSVLVSQAIEQKLPAVKFQSAYFEAYGAEGLQILQRSIQRLNDARVLSILDAKRGDISSTMLAYGRSAFEVFNADCLTINPYMGIDTIDPLLPWLKAGKGVYVVWLTSNKSADAFQMQPCAGSLPLVSHVHSVFKQYSQANSIEHAVGYVLGATKLANASVKALLTDLKAESFLLPGVGAQGAVVDSDLKLFLEKHFSSLVPVSREVGGLKAGIKSVEEYADQVKTAICRLKSDLSIPA